MFRCSPSGHVELLNYASSFGDYLIVAIDSDRKVAEMKGPDRPIFSQSIEHTC